MKRLVVAGRIKNGKATTIVERSNGTVVGHTRSLHTNKEEIEMMHDNTVVAERTVVHPETGEIVAMKGERVDRDVLNSVPTPAPKKEQDIMLMARIAQEGRKRNVQKRDTWRAQMDKEHEDARIWAGVKKFFGLN